VDHVLIGKQGVVTYDIYLVAFRGMYNVVNSYVTVE